MIGIELCTVYSFPRKPYFKIATDYTDCIYIKGEAMGGGASAEPTEPAIEGSPDSKPEGASPHWQPIKAQGKQQRSADRSHSPAKAHEKVTVSTNRHKSTPLLIPPASEALENRINRHKISPGIMRPTPSPRSVAMANQAQWYA
jgi:hypothetical protein